MVDKHTVSPGERVRVTCLIKPYRKASETMELFLTVPNDAEGSVTVHVRRPVG